MTDMPRAPDSAVATDSLLNIVQLSSYLGVPVPTLRQWTFRRCIPFIKLNRLVRFERTDIDAWIRSSTRRDLA